MTFHSYIFTLCFLPACIAGYYFLNHLRFYQLGLCFLLAMSLWFYGYFNPGYLVVIIGSILGNYFIYRLVSYAGRLGRRNAKKAIAVFGVCLDLAVLGYFKYTDFLIGNVNLIFRQEFNLRHILLPLGISFFTFQQVSFLVDAYRDSGEGGMTYSLLEYAAYVCFFPQLVAGPIVTHGVLVPQLKDRARKCMDWDYMARGIMLFVLGLAKKILLADVFGNAADWAYANVDALNSTEAVIAVLSYTIQIYFDFSGYSDMAVGLGWMMHIDLPVNFDSPYKALTVTGFWKRWHMTLTSFFTEYLYIPLGGSRKGTVRTYANIFAVFFLSGLWHGAGWTFILWGAMHGCAQILERMCRKFWEGMHPVFSWLLAFGFINAAWVFFRADGIAMGMRIIKLVVRMDFGPIHSEILGAFSQPEWGFLLQDRPDILAYYPNFILLLYFLVAFFIILGMPNAKAITEKHVQGRVMPVAVAALFVWCVFSFSGISSFLYFNF